MKNTRHLAMRLGLVMLVLAFCGCGQEKISYELAGTSAESAVSAGPGEDTEPEVPGEIPTAENFEEQGEDGKHPGVIYVYICGAVANPGVYPLPEGSRVYELLEAAGGLADEADEKALNQARVLSDGEQVTVYTAGETARMPTAEPDRPAEASMGGTGKVNLNTADAATLQTLSGIGEARAQAIIAYREAQGGFRRIEEIMEIEGIKEKLFEKIREQIEV